jgi:4'-phosphopantetheinyl transferase
VHAIPNHTLHGGLDRASVPGYRWLRDSIDDGEVHVWSMPSGTGDDAIALALLDDSERARANRFRAARDRHWYVSHHAFVRRVLGRYLGVAPSALMMRVGTHGKPELAPDQPLAFNASRSGGLSVVAVASAPVGVDIEQVRPIDDALQIADGLFADGERRRLRMLPRSARSQAFLALWTRKESVVKATGRGLSQPLDAFDVSAGKEDMDGRWHSQLGSTPLVVAQLDAPSGWLAAVSLTGRRLDVRYMDAAVLLS